MTILLLQFNSDDLISWITYSLSIWNDNVKSFMIYIVFKNVNALKSLFIYLFLQFNHYVSDFVAMLTIYLVFWLPLLMWHGILTWDVEVVCWHVTIFFKALTQLSHFDKGLYLHFLVSRLGFRNTNTWLFTMFKLLGVLAIDFCHL